MCKKKEKAGCKVSERRGDIKTAIETAQPLKRQSSTAVL